MVYSLITQLAVNTSKTIAQIMMAGKPNVHLRVLNVMTENFGVCGLILKFANK